VLQGYDRVALVHHPNDRIPTENLQRAPMRTGTFHEAPPVRAAQLHALRLTPWDRECGRLFSFAETEPRAFGAR
jgi:hypothetical protein